MFDPFFSPLLKVLERILKSRQISRALKETLIMKLVDTLMWLVVFGAIITGVVVLINAIR